MSLLFISLTFMVVAQDWSTSGAASLDLRYVMKELLWVHVCVCVEIRVRRSGGECAMPCVC